ncbi:hypothetical protein [Streptomyces sp. NPDC059010]|uniref:hypothetical protein n=1 Tax=Streptomyces sp. NPDC059010 TaxID=3346695 RepID=UPI003682B84D
MHAELVNHHVAVAPPGDRVSQLLQVVRGRPRALRWRSSSKATEDRNGPRPPLPVQLVRVAVVLRATEDRNNDRPYIRAEIEKWRSPFEATEARNDISGVDDSEELLWRVAFRGDRGSQHVWQGDDRQAEAEWRSLSGATENRNAEMEAYKPEAKLVAVVSRVDRGSQLVLHLRPVRAAQQRRSSSGRPRIAIMPAAASLAGAVWWRSPSGVTEDRNIYNAWPNVGATQWRSPSGATEDRNDIEVANKSMGLLVAVALPAAEDRNQTHVTAMCFIERVPVALGRDRGSQHRQRRPSRRHRR